MKNFKHLLFLMMCYITLSSFTENTDEMLLSHGITPELLDEMKNDTIVGTTGVVDFSVCHSSINVPQGFIFLDKEQTRRLVIDYWNNPSDRMENVLGCLVPSTSKAYCRISVAYVLSYDNCGYIKDDDVNSLDYDELLTEMQQQTIEENKNLPEEQRTLIKGWAVRPKYLAGSHVLVWAKTLMFDAGETINYDMRILGKDGLISINAVVSYEDCKEVIAKESEIINSLSFDKGYAYNDFDPDKDKISEWTLGGLVAGGILAKSGFFAKLGVLLVKFWKLGLVAIVGIGAGIRKWFKSRQEEE